MHHKHYLLQPLGLVPSLEQRAYQHGYCKPEQGQFVQYAPGFGDETINMAAKVPTFAVRGDIGTLTAGTITVRRSSNGASIGTLPSGGWSSVLTFDDPTVEMLVYNSAYTFLNFSASTAAFNEPLYLEIDAGAETWYSEDFVVANSNAEDFPECVIDEKGEWVQVTLSATCDLDNGFKGGNSYNTMLFTNLGRPEYGSFPEVKEGGNGGEKRLYNRVEKRYVLAVYAPEYFADAAAFWQLFKEITLTFADGSSLVGSNIITTVEWSTNCHAQISVAFTTELFTQTACCA